MSEIINAIAIILIESRPKPDYWILAWMLTSAPVITAQTLREIVLIMY